MFEYELHQNLRNIVNDLRSNIDDDDFREDTKDILFIDTSNAFENVLLSELIDLTASTYGNRDTQNKYNYATTLTEVHENDYN